ncbi:3-deoxy-7-phosphoheptulonate synthase [Actinomadura rupiterrae]|uniref:3-deoxy-7-phosphoheptulonate synthase n=1 Tax=Actinomadura rupiterrae TaxID=559627 RepID=UPI0020A37858|nr:3-deoxy-7-phosphoheptulonate synthase [Actinomadura rupiterrae]MCP2338093.1 3-deoxy-7-phosphoheptulonate synthase [Actinomadura rupiterrae]
MSAIENSIRTIPARQQPDWPDPDEARRVSAKLAALPGLVTARQVRALNSRLAQVAAGEALVLQAGDCAEDFAECHAAPVARKAELVRRLAAVMAGRSGLPIVRVGRIGGQFAKPRSDSFETVSGQKIPSYRGHLVNAPAPLATARVPDPERMLIGYEAAERVLRCLGWIDEPGGRANGLSGAVLWTSHEALLLDYELPMIHDSRYGPVLASTHWPWIGERTRHSDGAHVAMLAAVTNPVACKVGPRCTPSELLELCSLLDPARVPGRLTLISRMGADNVSDALPELVARVREAGHPVIWLCDPMHGNTFKLPSGHKTRRVETVIAETAGFHDAVRRAGGVPGGLHLEITPDDVTECIDDSTGTVALESRYGSLCDPRLSPGQAESVVRAWRTSHRLAA